MARIDNLVVGQEVAIGIAGCGFTRATVWVVERITATQVTIGGRRFKLSDGWGIGMDNRYFIIGNDAESIADARDREEKHNLRKKFVEYARTKLTDAQIKAAVEAIEKHASA